MSSDVLIESDITEAVSVSDNVDLSTIKSGLKARPGEGCENVDGADTTVAIAATNFLILSIKLRLWDSDSDSDSAMASSGCL